MEVNEIVAELRRMQRLFWDAAEKHEREEIELEEGGEA